MPLSGFSILNICFLVISNCSILKAQDSIVLIQKNAALFSNQYIFYRNNTFKHCFLTDDGQIWYGTGTFTDKGKTRFLQFGDPDTTYKTTLQVHFELNFLREMKIRGQNLRSADYYGTTRKRWVTFSPRKHSHLNSTQQVHLQ